MRDNKNVTYNIVWSVAERLSSQIVYFIVSVLLARIIDPTDYGVVTTVTVIINIFCGAIQSGFSSAIIYTKDPDVKHYTTAFWSTLGICSFLYVILFSVAPFVADFYDNDSIVLYMRVMSVQIIIQGLQSIPFAYVSKNMQFRKNYIATFVGVVVAAGVSLGLAFSGYGIWALIALTPVEVFASMITLWCMTHLKIQFSFDFSLSKKMFSYCWKLMGVDVLNSLYTSINSIIIGKKYTQADVAYYNRGSNLPQTLLGSVNTAVSKVLFPVFAAYDDRKIVKANLRLSIRIINFISYPMLFGMLSVAEEIVVTLYSSKWIGIVPYLKLMCVAWAFQPIQICVIQAMKAMGKSGEYFRLEIIKKIASLVYLGAAIVFGSTPLALAGVLILGQITSVILNVSSLKKILTYTYGEQIKDIFASTIPCIAMVVCVYLVGLPLNHTLLRMVIRVLVGIVSYLLLSIITKSKELTYLLNRIIKRRGN